MGYTKGVLEYLAEHGYTEGIIITGNDDEKHGTILRFFYNYETQEWMIRRVE